MKIICVGKNYLDHIKEFDGEIPKTMVLFMKPDTAVHNPELPFYIPDFTQNLHYELEIVLKINQNGKCIAEKFAHKYYDEITVGIDFTARDLQKQLASSGLSWERAKAFDGSAVIGKFIDKNSLGNLDALSFSMNKNNQLAQIGNTNQMLWNFNQIIAEASQYLTLRKGDLIFTGTPKGVGKVTEGDVFEGFLNNESCFKINVK